MNTTTILKTSLLLSIFMLCVTLKINAQQATKPNICINPPSGYTLGGDFSLQFHIACLDFFTGTTRLAVNNPLGINKGSEAYIFNYKDGDSLIFTKQNNYIVNNEGIYWILQSGTFTEEGVSKNVLICKSIEAIKPGKPDLEYSTCGSKTINVLIKDTPVNQKQSGYRIRWDEKNVSTYKTEKLPFVISYTYSGTPLDMPSIQGFYDRNGVTVCFGEPYIFSVKSNFSLSKLESLNDGKEVKVKMEGGKAGKEYYIQYKAKTATEWVESKTRIKRNAADTFGESNIVGLEPATQYCFRLAEKDTCNYAVAYSNEVCITYIPPTPPFISQLEGLNEGKEAKITITDGYSGADYTIQYRLKNASVWTDSPVKFKKNDTVSEQILTGLESNKDYCFRIVQKDSGTGTEIFSNEACSISLKSTLLSDKEVKLEWHKIDSPQFERARIGMIEESGLNGNTIPLGQTSDTTFIFDQLTCLVKYKFSLELTFRNNNDFAKKTVIISPQILVDPKSVKLQPMLTSLGVVSVNGANKISYSMFSTSNVTRFDIYRSVNGGEMMKISEGSPNSFMDTNVDVGNNYYCYAHKYVNGCGNESELSGRSCQVKLSSKTYGKLSWNPFAIQADTNLLKKEKAEYIVQMVTPDGLVMNTVGKTTDTTVTVPIENYPMFEPSYKFRVLASIQGQLYYNGGFISFPFFVFSHPVSIMLPPIISQLEGLNEGKEAKLSMRNVVSGKKYIIQYRLKSAKDWVDSSVKIKSAAELGEATFAGLETNKSYCFRIIERDSASKTETISNEVCSIVLKSTLLSSKNVRLQWSKPDKNNTGITAIVVMDENGNSVNNLDFGEISDTTFIHNELNCLTKFKYSVVVKSINANSAIVKSPQILVDPKSLLTPPNLQSVDVVSIGPDNQPFYDTYLLAPMPKYEIYRSTNGGQMIKVGEDKSASFADKNVDTGNNYYCYAHKYINECGNTSELSLKTCTIKLSSGSLGKLTWSPYKIYTDTDLYKVAKTDYIVQVMDTLKNTIDYLDPIRDTTFIVEEKYGKSVKYKVRANVLGYINLGMEVRQQEISSYSNTVAPYLVLSNESSKIDLSVFPNPAEDRVRINSAGVPVRFIEVIDLKGRLIYKGRISDNIFDLSAFEKGKYILRLYDTNNRLLSTKSIVKW